MAGGSIGLYEHGVRPSLEALIFATSKPVFGAATVMGSPTVRLYTTPPKVLPQLSLLTAKLG